ncbi:MAG: DUF2156 domain-containing protein, partial [candidate division Zixibacteria bacterium]|nr:DUF2156 domain-containing protein [Gammaproteobacteria bacterium]NIW47394.1 DUF2156 domain-containing protein [Gammaproteobacteria bacterium]NIX58307.1 DUF2156 domain-containing protein [candidate division Zixibacteria bacterium]
MLITGENAKGLPFGLPPVGPHDLTPSLNMLFDFLSNLTPIPQIHRVPETLAQRYAEALSLAVEEDRANSDYVYRTESLINLSGRKYHRKRNHLRQFRSRYSYKYEPIGKKYIEASLGLEEEWCRLRSCADNPALLNEEQAIREALIHFDELDYQGGVILVNGRVVA